MIFIISIVGAKCLSDLLALVVLGSINGHHDMGVGIEGYI